MSSHKWGSTARSGKDFEWEALKGEMVQIDFIGVCCKRIQKRVAVLGLHVPNDLFNQSITPDVQNYHFR